MYFRLLPIQWIQCCKICLKNRLFKIDYVTGLSVSLWTTITLAFVKIAVHWPCLSVVKVPFWIYFCSGVIITSSVAFPKFYKFQSWGFAVDCKFWGNVQLLLLNPQAGMASANKILNGRWTTQHLEASPEWYQVFHIWMTNLWGTKITNFQVCKLLTNLHIVIPTCS